MNDTTPEMENRLDALCAEKTPAERLRMGCSMFAVSRELVRAGILRHRPKTTAAELRLEMFRIYYSEDFSDDECDRIVEHLRNSADRAAGVVLNSSELTP